MIDFSSNIYNYANQERLREHLAAHLDCIHHYPLSESLELEKLLAEKLEIPLDCVMVTSGCTEAIYLLAQLFHGYSSVIPQPTFSAYATACRIHHHTVSYEKTEELSHLPGERIYWICNPNSPSGNVLMKGFLDYVVRRSTNYHFIVDQSYEHYTRAGVFVPKEVTNLPNLVLLHSMSKQYSIPGLRLGYVTACPAIIQRLRTIRQPWSVNAVAIEAGRWLLNNGEERIADLDDRLEETERLRNELRKIAGIRMFESKSCFMLGQLEKVTAAELKEYLLNEHDMLIRDCSDFAGLTRYFFRVTTQTPEENDRLIAAIRSYMEKNKNI